MYSIGLKSHVFYRIKITCIVKEDMRRRRRNTKTLTATEFFMSARTEANSVKCSSGVYGRG